MVTYLDHNASSPIRASARQAHDAALDQGGNASSVHRAGRAARARIEKSREQVARLAGANSGAIVFVSGGTEANALALSGAIGGAAQAENRITRLFVSAIEHESVRSNAAALAETVPGLKLKEIPVTANGTVDLEKFRLDLMQGKGRALICVMAANNETGVIQDIASIVKLVRTEGGEDSLLLVDGVQAAGRMAIDFDKSGADYLSLSAHKIGGPQGAGALIVKDGAPLAPLIRGGGQEMGRRSGTENVAAIAGFGAAAEEAVGFALTMPAMQALRDRFESELKRIAPDAELLGVSVPRLANTSNFAIPGLSAETALIALDLDGVAVSSGSACSSGKVGLSHVLTAMGCTQERARCAIRVSFGWTNSDADVDVAIASLHRLIARRTALAA